MSGKNPIIRRTDFKQNQDTELVERIEKYRKKYNLTFINAIRKLCIKALELEESHEMNTYRSI
ncbi:MAG: hypothetical protein K2J32_08365 [Ruminococcus sp.]|nr:hypothetical protein [Ruminococcus sp.]